MSFTKLHSQTLPKSTFKRLFSSVTRRRFVQPSAVLLRTQLHTFTMSANAKTAAQEEAQMNNLWAKEDSIAAKYARSEAATRPYADIFMEKSNIANTSSDIHVFDVGCGTGAVVAALYGAVPKEKWHHVSVLGGDVSDSMLDYLKDRAEKEGWTGVKTEIINGAVCTAIGNQGCGRC